jgi:hypothetical protein
MKPASLSENIVAQARVQRRCHPTTREKLPSYRKITSGRLGRVLLGGTSLPRPRGKRPGQVKGKYPTADKTDKNVYGYIGKLTELHPDMVLAIPFSRRFSNPSPSRRGPWSRASTPTRPTTTSPADVVLGGSVSRLYIILYLSAFPRSAMCIRKARKKPATKAK